MILAGVVFAFFVNHVWSQPPRQQLGFPIYIVPFLLGSAAQFVGGYFQERAIERCVLE